MAENLPDTNVGNIEYIRRQDVVEECGEWYVEEGTEEGFIGTVSQMLNMFSPADVAPVRNGHWVATGDEPFEVWECDRCGFEIDGSGCIDPEAYRDVYNFCPNCGAKMDGEDVANG